MMMARGPITHVKFVEECLQRGFQAARWVVAIYLMRNEAEKGNMSNTSSEGGWVPIGGVITL